MKSKRVQVEVKFRVLAVVREGTDINKLLKSQEYVVEPTNQDGCVLEFEYEGIASKTTPTAKAPSKPVKATAKKTVKAKGKMSEATKKKIAIACKKAWLKRVAMKNVGPKKEAQKPSTTKVISNATGK